MTKIKDLNENCFEENVSKGTNPEQIQKHTMRTAVSLARQILLGIMLGMVVYLGEARESVGRTP